MLPIKYTSGDRTLLCPYDKTHIILAKSYNAHLIRCRQNHRDCPMAVCCFDKTHVIPKPEKAHHESECPSQYLLDRERQRRAGDSGLRGNVQGPPIVADHNSAIDVEDWGACPPSSTPALFNKREDREHFVGPYIPKGALSSQHSMGKLAQGDQRGHSLPHTPSLAASVAPPASKAKTYPSSVFEYTSGYGRGRGKVGPPLKPKLEPSLSPSLLTSPPSSGIEKGQYDDEDGANDSLPPQASNSKASITEFSPRTPVKTEVESNAQLQMKFLKEREQQLHQCRNRHREEMENMVKEQELKILELQGLFVQQQQQLLARQQQEAKEHDEHLLRLQELMMKSNNSQSPVSPKPGTIVSPPGFNNKAVATSGAPAVDVSSKTSAKALQKEIKFSPEEKESWHEETGNGQGLNFFTEQGLSSRPNLTSAGSLANVTNWLNCQGINDIDDMGLANGETESPSDVLKSRKKLEKKLRQITVLEQKVSLGHKLSQQEEEKLNQKSQIKSLLATIIDHNQP